MLLACLINHHLRGPLASCRMRPTNQITHTKFFFKEKKNRQANHIATIVGSTLNSGKFSTKNHAWPPTTYLWITMNLATWAGSGDKQVYRNPKVQDKMFHCCDHLVKRRKERLENKSTAERTTVLLSLKNIMRAVVDGRDPCLHQIHTSTISLVKQNLTLRETET